MEQNKQTKRNFDTWLMAVALLLLILTGGMARGQVQEEWVARYNGPGNNLDRAVAVAVDSMGNIYVVGESRDVSSDSDYATIKYDADGFWQWTARYNGPGNSIEWPAWCIAVDASGNVYVTGASQSSSYDNFDFATIKYDTNGTELWVARYNGPGNHTDTAEALTIDASGNVYVTGSSASSSSGDNDFATIKYDTNGNQLWVARYNGPTNGGDSGEAITVDEWGNVYVTGSSDGGSSDTDYATIKYAANGDQLWVARYNGPRDTLDSPDAISVDTWGNVYVAGNISYYRNGSFLHRDYATVKYDAFGNQLWEAIYASSRKKDDHFRAMALDASGNVYVTGLSEGSGTERDYVTIKYDTNGNQLWLRLYNGPGNWSDIAYDIALDESGNVYVTGCSMNSPPSDYYDTSTYDYATIKYDANGNEIWVGRYNGPDNLGDFAYALTLDNLGNVYITGTSYGISSNTDYVTIKYSQSGNQSPVADAGSDQTVIDIDGDEIELVTLDGLASFDPDGTIIGYQWKSGENILGTDAVLDVIFPLGVWPITLTVTDNEGAIDTDEVTITVAADVPYIDAPSNLQASVSQKTVTLTWSDNSDNEAGFFIERRPKTSSDYEQVGQVGAGVTSFIDSGLDKGRYYYRVQAFNAQTVSDYSNVAGVNIK